MALGNHHYAWLAQIEGRLAQHDEPEGAERESLLRTCNEIAEIDPTNERVVAALRILNTKLVQAAVNRPTAQEIEDHLNRTVVAQCVNPPAEDETCAMQSTLDSYLLYATREQQFIMYWLAPYKRINPTTFEGLEAFSPAEIHSFLQAGMPARARLAAAQLLIQKELLAEEEGRQITIVAAQCLAGEQDAVTTVLARRIVCVLSDDPERICKVLEETQALSTHEHVQLVMQSLARIPIEKAISVIEQTMTLMSEHSAYRNASQFCTVATERVINAILRLYDAEEEQDAEIEIPEDFHRILDELLILFSRMTDNAREQAVMCFLYANMQYQIGSLEEAAEHLESAQNICPEEDRNQKLGSEIDALLQLIEAAKREEAFE